MTSLFSHTPGDTLSNYVRKMFTVNDVDIGSCFVNMILAAIRSLPSPTFNVEKLSSKLRDPYGNLDRYTVTFTQAELDSVTQTEFYMTKNIYQQNYEFFNELDQSKITKEEKDLLISCKPVDIIYLFYNAFDYEDFITDAFNAIHYYNFKVEFDKDSEVWTISWYYPHK